MKSQTIPILLNLLASFIGAFGQYFYKMGSNRLGHSSIWSNWPIALGMLFFILVMVLFIIGFKLGGRLSVVYPIYASTFVWGTMLGIYLDKEPWNWMQLSGSLLVILGIIAIAMNSAEA
jgi:multidrug transporter EmrE-like cation transporter